MALVNGWIFNVLELGIVDLDLYVSPDYDYQLLSKVLMSKTLVRLRVEGIDYLNTDVGDFSLPKLKTLYLDDVALEQVILHYDTPFDDDVSTVSTALQMLEKVASTKCKIQVISDNAFHLRCTLCHCKMDSSSSKPPFRSEDCTLPSQRSLAKLWLLVLA
ncbi:unnamed protein product [Thlaspi arvense]|uniref:Uncharacterized protein n=1 Tax=Thlaspi arvense TaxID=13288 RepID=A0AAU9SCH4_THLAR|nr:unnamed protein product [Thlaspi arvense]